MPSAQDRALLMPEVLEFILLQVPFQDLLINAQRVNHLFHDVILSSRSLQQALFFHPTQGSSHGKVQYNSILQKKFPPWFEDKWLMARTYRLSDHKHFWRLDWNSSKEIAKAYARKEASWRRMLVAQPPVQELIVKIRSEAIEGPSQSRGDLSFKDGLRMGLFYDLVQDFVEHQPATYFVIRWYLPQHVFEDDDGDVAESDDGENRSFITVHLRQVIQSRPGLTGKIGPEFKSLAYEPVNVNYSPVISEPVFFGARVICQHKRTIWTITHTLF